MQFKFKTLRFEEGNPCRQGKKTLEFETLRFEDENISNLENKTQ